MIFIAQALGQLGAYMDIGQSTIISDAILTKSGGTNFLLENHAILAG